MGWFKDALKNALSGGMRVGYSSGKPFDPRNQKRTDAIKDIANNDRVKCNICGKKTRRCKAIRCQRCFGYTCKICIWKPGTRLCKPCGEMNERNESTDTNNS